MHVWMMQILMICPWYTLDLDATICDAYIFDPCPWCILVWCLYVRCILGLAMHMRNMRIMRICGICGCVCGLKISSTLYTYEYLPKMATFWARNGSAWLCFQFWVPKISLLFIPPGFIHPQEWKLRVQNHKILVKKRWFFLLLMRFMRIDAHLMRIDAHQQK